MASIASYLVSQGYNVFVNYVQYIPPEANTGSAGEAASVALAAYLPVINGLVAGSVRQGDQWGWSYAMDNQAAWYQSDLVHPNAVGVIGVSGLTDGQTAYVMSPWACSIVGWDLVSYNGAAVTAAVAVAKASGSIPNMSANSIVASAPPGMTTAALARGACPGACAGWTTSVAQGDVIGVQAAIPGGGAVRLGLWCQR
jgi:hypothetical protein